MTRYPKAGRGAKWTVLELKAVPPAWRGDTLSDGRGLFGEVKVSTAGDVSVRFRSAFKREGKLAWHLCGYWPESSLEDVRIKRDRARVTQREGIDPNAADIAARQEHQAQINEMLESAALEADKQLTVKDLFEAWLQTGVARRDGNYQLRRGFEKDILPRLGKVPLCGLTEAMIVTTLRRLVEKRGVNRTAVKLHKELTQMLSWGEGRRPWRGLLIDGNPAKLVNVRKVVDGDYDLSNERTRLLSADEIHELHVKLQTMRAEWQAAPDRRSAPRPLRRETELALWICLSTSCRIGELLRAEWAHVDMLVGTWFIPAENAKHTNAKPQDQLVQMSGFTRRQFKALQELTGETKWCFPAMNNKGHVDEKTVTKQVGDRQVRFKNRRPLLGRRHDDTLVLADGTKGEWTPHDLRRTASTMMQSLGVLPHVVDRCQNHVMGGGKVRRHYQLFEYAAEKADAWARLGNRLDQILNGTNVLPFLPRLK